MPTPASQSIQEKKYIPALDGLRGVAILLVLTFHYFGQFSFFAMGWCGLDLFFVLSGYLITSRLIGNSDKHNRYSRFYRNRALRILPLYYLVLLAYFIGIFFVVSPANFHRFGFYLQNWPGFVFFFQNWTFIFNGQPTELHLTHLWSLAVEEQFYLLWPLLLYTFYKTKNFKNSLWIIVIAVTATRCLLYYFNPGFTPYYAIYYNTFCRSDAFIIGSLTFLILNSKPVAGQLIPVLSYVSWGIIAAGLFITRSADHTGTFFGTVGYTALAFIFAGFIFIINTKQRSLIHRFFAIGILRHIGKISYGLYIFHWPVLLIAGSSVSLFIQHSLTIAPSSANLLSSILCAVLSYGIALGSFYYFERYFLKQKE